MTIETARFIRSKPFGFLQEEDIIVLADLDRLFPVLVRCGGGRFTAAAQDVIHFIRIVTDEGTDYVRDVAVLATDWAGAGRVMELHGELSPEEKN
jgi:hypothetical protein